jgi:hypothetical protein
LSVSDTSCFTGQTQTKQIYPTEAWFGCKMAPCNEC